MTKLDVIAVLVGTFFCASVHAEGTWFRGNVHVHTDQSDGFAPASEVVAWYRNHDYDFLVLTDHNLQSVTSELQSQFESPGRFLLLPGMEITDAVQGRPVHLNALGIEAAIEPQGGDSVADAIQRNRAATEAAGGLAILNHPNGLLRAALTAEEIQAGAATHFEVCCADYLGGSGHPSTDEIWDTILTNGSLLYGVAADDAHDFGPDSRDPGSAWIMVRAAELSQPAILQAIRSGDFYATTGVLFEEIQQKDDGVCLRIAEYEDYGFRTDFIGAGGDVLHTDESRNPRFVVAAAVGYVRARVFRSDGALAWVQPVMLGVQ